MNCPYRNDKIQFDSIKYGFLIGNKKILFQDSNRFLINEKVPIEILNENKRKKELYYKYFNKIKILISKQKKGGYGEIGRRYGLNWIEPWYGNLLSENFQIQRNPGINKNGQS